MLKFQQLRIFVKIFRSELMGKELDPGVIFAAGKFLDIPEKNVEGTKIYSIDFSNGFLRIMHQSSNNERFDKTSQLRRS